MDWRHLDELLAAGRDAYGELINLCIWTKDNGGMGSLYRMRIPGEVARESAMMSPTIPI